MLKGDFKIVYRTRSGGWELKRRRKSLKAALSAGRALAAHREVQSVQVVNVRRGRVWKIAGK